MSDDPTKVDDLSVAQELSERAARYRTMGEHHEAERVFQLAVRIWERKGWPRDEYSVASNFGDWARTLRKRLSTGDEDAKSEFSEAMRRLGPWYHNVEFAPGTMSNPSNRDYPAARWRVISPLIPSDLRGKSVLDIGCNSGFFSLEMKKRGAGRVVGIDIMPHLLAQSRFASHWFELPLELREMSAYDVESLNTQFDLVIFVGVLYHLKHPLYALEKIASVCKDIMVFQSVVHGDPRDFNPIDNYPASEKKVFDQPAWPKLYFIEKSFNEDESNWWFATRSCLKAMLRVSGFRIIEDTQNTEIFICRK